MQRSEQLQVGAEVFYRMIRITGHRTPAATNNVHNGSARSNAQCSKIRPRQYRLFYFRLGISILPCTRAENRSAPIRRFASGLLGFQAFRCQILGSKRPQEILVCRNAVAAWFGLRKQVDRMRKTPDRLRSDLGPVHTRATSKITKTSEFEEPPITVR